MLLINLNKLISTFFFFGYFPKLPGTFGTLGGVFLYILIFHYFKISNIHFLIVIIIIILLSIYTSDKSIKFFHNSDPKEVVIDEVAGFFVTMLFVPFSIVNIIIGFLLFRLFDVSKLFFVKKLERLPGGVGITMDDVGAGIISNVLLQIMIY